MEVLTTCLKNQEDEGRAGGRFKGTNDKVVCDRNDIGKSA